MYEQTNSAFKHSSEAECLNPTYRPTMEDVHIIVDQFCDNPNQAFFAVYDGHGGIIKVLYCRKRNSSLCWRTFPHQPC